MERTWRSEGSATDDEVNVLLWSRGWRDDLVGFLVSSVSRQQYCMSATLANACQC
jgi:hypothetical protein